MAWDDPVIRDKNENIIGKAPAGHFQDERSPLSKIFLGPPNPASLTSPLTAKSGLASINEAPVRAGKLDLKMKRNPYLDQLRVGQRKRAGGQ